MVGADSGLASPAAADHFARNGRTTLGNGVDEFPAQIEIAPDAFVVGTIESEHGLGVMHVHNVLEVSARKNIARRMVIEVRRQ